MSQHPRQQPPLGPPSPDLPQSRHLHIPFPQHQDVMQQQIPQGGGPSRPQNQTQLPAHYIQYAPQQPQPQQYPPHPHAHESYQPQHHHHHQQQQPIHHQYPPSQHTLPPLPPGYAHPQQDGRPSPAPGYFHPYAQQLPPPSKATRANGSVAGTGRRDTALDTESINGTERGLKRDKKKHKGVLSLARNVAAKERFHRQYAETRERLSVTTRILLANPSDSRAYALQLYPHSLERAAMLSEIELREEWAVESARSFLAEERSKAEEEWKRGKERIRERLLEGLEERRKKAREEMASDGQLADAPTFELPQATRGALSHKTSSEKPPLFVLAAPHPFGAAGEEMSSTFPLPLTAYTGGAWGTSGRKRQKGVGPSGGLQLGKAISALTSLKESEIEADLGELKKAMKRKRRAGQGIVGQYRDQ
ncbi:hypothetical protein FRB94_013064 [Tulasnella sp. JGI-2019a]|nr:hypothetical protein FRB93_001855 [Tulasnella sp. JGI-2019a]KAG9008657.1 hypothetical protein FRB94_013064 [Tulasnella sp. JGI-2019a]KAG9033850.1 hypothetical protein FRB95_014172 [Tulasnella sp. JGI-2019a]